MNPSELLPAGRQQAEYVAKLSTKHSRGLDQRYVLICRVDIVSVRGGNNGSNQAPRAFGTCEKRIHQLGNQIKLFQECAERNHANNYPERRQHTAHAAP